MTENFEKQNPSPPITEPNQSDNGDIEVWLRDYTETRRKHIIPHIEDVKNMYVNIMSGDELLYVIYKDRKYPMLILDSIEGSGLTRTSSYMQGTYDIPIDLLMDFSSFVGSSSDCMDMIIKKRKERGDIIAGL
jgi:hypothetical protein